MQLDECLADQEPNASFHGASIKRISVDYLTREAILDCSICVGDPSSKDEEVREARRGGRLRFQGLYYYVADPPDPEYPYIKGEALRISDDGTLTVSGKQERGLPTNVPPGFVEHYFFVDNWNAFIYLAAESAGFDWEE